MLYLDIHYLSIFFFILGKIKDLIIFHGCVKLDIFWFIREIYSNY